MPAMLSGPKLCTLQVHGALPAPAGTPQLTLTLPVAEIGGSGRAANSVTWLPAPSVQLWLPISAGSGVCVGVFVGVKVRVAVGVAVDVAVRVSVRVGVAVAVLVAVRVDVAVAVLVTVRVLVAVRVTVAVKVAVPVKVA